MIKSVQITSGYAVELPHIKGRTFEFKPGLNILYGPNGCGKSTLLKVMAAYSAIATGGWSKVQSGLRLNGFSSEKLVLPKGFAQISPGKCEAEVAWDATPSYLHRSEDTNRTETGYFMTSVDDSADGETDMAQQVYDLTARPSSGQKRNTKMSRAILAMQKPKTSLELPKRSGGPVSDAQVEYFETLRPTGVCTFMIDEPETSLDIPTQLILWHNIFLRLLGKTRQVIITTHSYIPIFLKHSMAGQLNFVDVVPGYSDACHKLMTAQAANTLTFEDILAVLEIKR